MTERPFKARNTLRAQELRNQAPPAERKLWQYLSRSQLGVKFSRQIPIGPYFGDFVSRSRKLIVELDGYSHDTRTQHDLTRARYLEAEGFLVLRFTNDDVFNNVEGVLLSIGQALQLADSPTPSPSRLREGDYVAHSDKGMRTDK